MKKDIQALENEILKHKKLYYQGKAKISDEEYDALENNLKKLAPESPVLSMVGSSVFSGEKVAHAKKMLSLNKTYVLDDLLRWMGDEKLLGAYKIDGSSCSLIYEEGKLSLAKTRGDGKVGENITQKAWYLPDIPKELKAYKKKIEVRGEVYCTEENFVHLTEYMTQQGLERPSSLRNIVAGILGRKENIDLARFLSFSAFELLGSDEIKSESDKFTFFKQHEFEIPPYSSIKNHKDVENFLVDVKNFIDNGDYLIDGAVFTYESLELQDKLGETAHHPRYKIAYKFQGATKDTQIKKITWQVSRSGNITPVALVETVELSGAQVSRVTLHNYGIVKAHGLKKGDTIKIVRSGEVIPKFLEVVNSSNAKFSVPEVCPSCAEEAYKEDIRLVCKNSSCPAQIKDSILNFIQKIGIDDLSSKRLQELIDSGMVTSIDDLYRLTREKLMELDKVKEKLSDKIIRNIKKSKNSNLIVFLSALGISGGAYNKCEKVVDNGYDNVEKLKSLNVEKLTQIDSFAQKSAEEFLSSLESKFPLVDRLLELGFRLTVKEKKESGITGKKICITGTLSMKRGDLTKIIKDHGGIVSSSVSKETDFLVTNDEESSSSKFTKAQKLEIPIINEKTLLEMI